MATPIEEQIHRHFIAVEAEKAKAENRKPRPVPKPWTRIHEQALCQELDLLQVVKEYDYQLEDEGFQAYCRSRGVLHVAGVKDSRRWRFLSEHFNRTKDEYLNDPDFQFAQESGGARYKYTGPEMESGWRIIELGRARLQDCWELYKAQE